MARVLKVTRSGFYVWFFREPSKRELEDAVLKPLIRKAHDESRGTYGSRRIKADLAAQGHIVGLDRISRLRKEMKLECSKPSDFPSRPGGQHRMAWTF